MPTRPRARCTTPGCGQPSDNGRCDGCRARRQHTGNTRREHWRTLYGPLWPYIRLDYLTRHPVCRLCGRRSEVPDHHPRGIRQLRRAGIDDPHQDRYLRPLCADCHNRETARREPGGWHRDRRT